jgi:hypothetical protein
MEKEFAEFEDRTRVDPRVLALLELRQGGGTDLGRDVGRELALEQGDLVLQV